MHSIHHNSGWGHQQTLLFVPFPIGAHHRLLRKTQEGTIQSSDHAGGQRSNVLQQSRVYPAAATREKLHRSRLTQVGKGHFAIRVRNSAPLPSCSSHSFSAVQTQSPSLGKAATGGRKRSRNPKCFTLRRRICTLALLFAF